jgi:hypothetical protein
MRSTTLVMALLWAATSAAADVESRVLTHYLPQDFLEIAVRTEGWSKVVLNVPGGLRKGDVIRVWAGGSIDRGNGDQPGQNVAGPPGITATAHEVRNLALSAEAAHAYALLFKTDLPGIKKCAVPGKALELPLAKDKEQLWIGFNDERGRYLDNHLGRGRRHEFDPLWIRIEVVRLIVD